MTQQQLDLMVAPYGAWLEPIFPLDSDELKGFTIHGPYGRTWFIGVDKNGNVDEFSANLWIDMVSYAQHTRNRRIFDLPE